MNKEELEKEKKERKNGRKLILKIPIFKINKAYKDSRQKEKKQEVKICQIGSDEQINKSAEERS